MRAVVILALCALAVALGLLFGFLRAFIGVGLGALALLVGLRYLDTVISTPEPPEVADVADYGLTYVCTMCGLELKVEKAARDKAPTHCMEPMVLVRKGGKPPLRPL